MAVDAVLVLPNFVDVASLVLVDVLLRKGDGVPVDLRLVHFDDVGRQDVVECRPPVLRQLLLGLFPHLLDAPFSAGLDLDVHVHLLLLENCLGVGLRPHAGLYVCVDSCVLFLLLLQLGRLLGSFHDEVSLLWLERAIRLV